MSFCCVHINGAILTVENTDVDVIRSQYDYYVDIPYRYSTTAVPVGVLKVDFCCVCRRELALSTQERPYCTFFFFNRGLG